MLCCKLLRTRQGGLATLREVMQFAGKLFFLTINCFDKMARGGLQALYAWLALKFEGMSRLDTPHHMTPSLKLGLAFFE